MNESTSSDDFAVLKAAYGSHLAAASALGLDARHYRRIRKGVYKGRWTLQAIAEAAARVRAGQPPAPAQPQEAPNV